MSVQLFLDVYNEYWEVAQTKTSSKCKLLTYEYELEKSLSHFYDSMENEYTRELLNAINQFASEINSIVIWESVISKYNEDEQFELRYEFLKLPLFYCINQPRAIKDRFIFCTAHLCNQANNLFKDQKDDLPEDYKIRVKHFENKVSVWDSATALINALDNLASQSYINDTKNYRNMSHHSIPANFDHGHTNFITRTPNHVDTQKYISIEDGKEVVTEKTFRGTSYGFGGLEPLLTKDLIPIFIRECENAQTAFKAYWDLVLEHQSYKVD